MSEIEKLAHPHSQFSNGFQSRSNRAIDLPELGDEGGEGHASLKMTLEQTKLLLVNLGFRSYQFLVAHWSTFCSIYWDRCSLS